MEKQFSKNDQHWTEISKRIRWIQPWKQLKNVSFKKPVKIEWYLGGQLNVADNCIDRHLEKNGDKVAIIWEPDNPQESGLKITYKELHQNVCKMANILKKYGRHLNDDTIKNLISYLIFNNT